MPSSRSNLDKEFGLKSRLSPEVREKLIVHLDQHLDLEQWGFRLTYVNPKSDRKLIYDSPQCRVRFHLDIDVREGDRLLSWYARSHVPNEVDLIMEWEGEHCFAWHDIGSDPFWQYLEELTPQQAVEVYQDRSRWSARETYRQTDLARSLEGSLAWSVAFEAHIWKHHGHLLFSLFDMKQTQEWNDFRRYAREYYRLLPDDSKVRFVTDVWGIPPWAIC